MVTVSIPDYDKLELVHLSDLELIRLGNFRFDTIPYRGFDLLH